ncbi:MAG TPA: histidinol phosphatase [Clostridiales bacterium]|nr:histidinol phosphatase [Clostridiales bacterium]
MAILTSNMHTHSFFCDGEGWPEDYVRAALKKGFTDLGFSSHAPVPLETYWNMPEARAEQYVAHIRELQRKYAGQIRIYAGMEIDFFAGDRRGIFRRYDLDYTIGAVHFVEDKSGVSYTVDGSPEDFRDDMNRCTGGSIRQYVTLYYDKVQTMLRQERFDVLAHPDLIKRNNPGQCYFREDEAWYRKKVMETVGAIAACGRLAEVNTGGLARGRADDIYPSAWIIREMKKQNIPLTLNSDAHVPEQIDFYFPEAIQTIRAAGYREIWSYQDGKWVSNRI